MPCTPRRIGPKKCPRCGRTGIKHGTVCVACEAEEARRKELEERRKRGVVLTGANLWEEV